MKCQRIGAAAVLMGVLIFLPDSPVAAYPPAVGILGNSPNCLICHVSNGPWNDDEFLILDILDKETMTSLRQPDGTSKIEVPRGETRTVLTVIGRQAGDEQDAPSRNALIYVDPQTIGNSSLSKFPPCWEVNLPLGCRRVGDILDAYPGAHITASAMSIRATDEAQNAMLTLQVMLTKGESVKGKPREGMLGNYFERVVQLIVK